MTASADPDDAASCYQRAILLLDEHRNANDRKLLNRARELLVRAVELRPKHAASHAALGYTYDHLGRRAEQALASFREAHRLEPRDRISEVYVFTLLEELGREKDALAAIKAAAPRHGVDLAALSRHLRKAGVPRDARTILLNGFIRARNFFRSLIADEAERIRNKLEPGRAQREAAAQRERCAEDQRQLERSFDAARVPASIRALARWASRYGIGDDYCRPFLMKQLGKKQRATLIRELDEKMNDIRAWLDGFEEGKMTTEAAAFMYLALGAEEIRE